MKSADALWALAVFVAIAALIGLVLAAQASKRDAATTALRRSGQDLEARIAQQSSELAADRQALAEAQRLAALGSWAWDIDTDTMVWSAELYRILGIDASSCQASYDGLLSCVHPNDQGWVNDTISRARLSGDNFEFEHPLVWPDGKVRWVHSRGEVITTGSRVIAMRGTCQDITDRRLADEALRIAEERFRACFDRSGLGMAVCDSTGQCLRVNRALCAILDRNRDQLLAGRLRDITHPDDIDADAANLDRVARGDLAVYETDERYLRADGSDVWVHVTATRVRSLDGDTPHFLLQIENISNRKQAERRLAGQAHEDPLTGLANQRLLTDRLRAVLNATDRTRGSFGLLYIDLDRFQAVNDRWGHPVGDQVLQHVADRLRMLLRSDDTIARVGGDEFVVLVPSLDDRDATKCLVQRLREAIALPMATTAGPITVHASIGVAIADPDIVADADADTLLRLADSDMYQIKNRLYRDTSVSPTLSRTLATAAPTPNHHDSAGAAGRQSTRRHLAAVAPPEASEQTRRATRSSILDNNQWKMAVADELDRAGRLGDAMAVISVELTDLPPHAGHQLAEPATGIVGAAVRECDIVGRADTDHIGVLAAGCTDGDAHRLIDRLTTELEHAGIGANITLAGYLPKTQPSDLPSRHRR